MAQVFPSFIFSYASMLHTLNKLSTSLLVGLYLTDKLTMANIWISSGPRSLMKIGKPFG